MIKIVDSQKYSIRANGWIQDASDFDNLYSFVSIFNKNSVLFPSMKEKLLRIVEERDGRSRFIDLLNKEQIKLEYKDIVGTSFKPRKDSRCNGIGQLALTGQKREFQGDWPTDNFLRWAVALGFIKFNFLDDTYEITSHGIEFSSEVVAEKRMLLIKKQLMFYPPVKRVLELLEKEKMTKFGLGQKLGCIGEKGFTSISESLFIEKYFYTSEEKRKNLKSDYEGSSDKYARQICSWLRKLGIVKEFNNDINYKGLNIRLKSYGLTADGLEYLRKIRIQNTFRVNFGMLSMSIKNSEINKKRRALLLKYSTEEKLSIIEIIEKMKSHSIITDEYEIKDDIESLVCCGFDIKYEVTLQCSNNILDLEIPNKVILSSKDEMEIIKTELREKLHYIDHRLLNLIDYSYDKSSSKMFEVYTAEVFKLISNKTILLGGVNKPDVISSINNLGIIIDSKAYKDGFSIPISEEDKMVRYIEDIKTKNDDVNPTKWWENFDEMVDSFVFQYVSSKFTPGAISKVEKIKSRTGIDGSIINAKNLLLFAEDCIQGKVNTEYFSCNKEINV